MADTQKGTLTQLAFKGFACGPQGLLAHKSLTQKQWEEAGYALGTVSARLRWYIGDWLGEN